MLERVEKANLFTVPLDDEGHWYRYHHLFADALRRRLGQSNPELTPELHRRASRWYEREGFTNEAVGHALDAGTSERAALLVERHAGDMLARSELTALSSWLRALPHDLVSSRPRLCLAHCWLSLLGLKISELGLRVEEAERALKEREDSGRLSAEERDRLYGETLTLKAYVALYRGDLPRSVELSRRALGLVAQDDLFVRGAIAFCSGRAHLMGGDVVDASHTFAKAAEIAKKAGNRLLAVFAMANLAHAQEARGRLREAYETSLRTLELATGRDGRPLPLAAVAHYWLGALLYERNDLEAAERHLGQCIELGQRGGMEGVALNSYLVRALVRRARGDAEGAWEIVAGWSGRRRERIS
jgi:LuxR family maltose regulon positive regulatory protein